MPTLRNVAQSAPYFHDGSVESLEEAVRFMASGGFANRNKSPLLMDRGLSDRDIDDIVAILGALDCEATLEAPALP